MQFRAGLARRGLQTMVVTNLAEVVAIAEAQHAGGYLRALVAAGGDGTAAELVNRTSPGVPLALLPLGTENLLAKYIELLASPMTPVETLADGVVVKLDAGRANDRIFLLHIGVGFDAEVVHKLASERAGHITLWSYAKPILQTIWSYHYPLLRLKYDPSQDDVPGTRPPNASLARWAFIFNLPKYGRGLQFTPKATGTDGLLDLCAFHQGSLWHGLRYLSSAIRAGTADLHDSSTMQLRRLRIESDVTVRYQLDGDPGGTLPVDIEALPGRLTLVVPRSWATEHGFRIEPASL